MSRPGSTTARGYGWDHRRLASAMKRAALGTPCPICHTVMTDVRNMDLDHTVPRALDPTSTGDRVLCRRCNRSRGATLGNRLRARRSRPSLPRSGSF